VVHSHEAIKWFTAILLSSFLLLPTTYFLLPSPFFLLRSLLNLIRSGYLTREDHNTAPQSANTSAPGQPSINGKADKPVDAGEGVCATFLFELPMGNASSLYNQALSSTASTSASTAAPSSSSTTGRSSPIALKSPEGQGEGQVSPGRDHSPRFKGTEGNHSSSTNSSSSSSGSSSSSSSSSGRGIGESLSYGQRAHRMQEDNEETYKRQSRLCPSFSTSQQVSTAWHGTAQ
jgi:hypothetical protein